MKNSDDEDDEEEDDEDEDDDERESGNNKKGKRNKPKTEPSLESSISLSNGGVGGGENEDEFIRQSSECDTVDLNKDVASLKDLITDEKFLLVNTLNWEDNIMIDVVNMNTSAATTNTIAQPNETAINERVKYAGWIPSVEHRTMMSFQSKVLGIHFQKCQVNNLNVLFKFWN